MLLGGAVGGAAAVVVEAVEAAVAEVTGPVAGRPVVAGALREAAGDPELQAARDSAAASATAAVLVCLPVVLMAARYTQIAREAGRAWTRCDRSQ